MKFVSIDIETLGLDSEKCDLIEFGAVTYDLDNPKNFNNLPTFHAYIYPKENQYKGQPYAMSMHPAILRRIAEKMEDKEAHPEYTFISESSLGFLFKKFLVSDGFIADDNGRVTINVAGKNFMGFDNLFLRKIPKFSKHIGIRSRVLDPAILYYKEGDKALPSLSLCLKRAGLDSNVAHTAVADAIDVVKILVPKLSEKRSF